MSNANFTTVCANSNQLESASEIYAEQTYDISDVTPAEGYIYPIFNPLPLYYDVYSAVTPVEYNGTTFYYYQQYAVPLYSYSFIDVMPDNSAVSEIYSVSSEDSTNELPEHESIELSLEDPVDDVITLNVEGESENDDISDKSEEILESAARPDEISCTVEIDSREGDLKQVNKDRMESSYDNMRENETQNDLYQDIGQENEFCIDPYSDSFDEKDYNTESCHGDPVENEYETACSDSFDEEDYNIESCHADPVENDLGTACTNSIDKEDYNTKSCHGDPIENEFWTACGDSFDEENYNTTSCHGDPIENEFGTAGSDSFDKEGYNTEACLCDPTENEPGTACSDSFDEEDYNTESCHDDPIENEFGTAGSDSFDKEGYNTEACHDDPIGNEFGAAGSDNFDEEDYNTESCHGDPAENEFGTASSDEDLDEIYSNSVRCSKLRIEDPVDEVISLKVEEDKEENDISEISEQTLESTTARLDKDSCTEKKEKWDGDNKEIDADMIVSFYDKLSDNDDQKNSCEDSGQEKELCKDPFKDSFDDEGFNIESCYGDQAENELRTDSSDEDIHEKSFNLQVRCGKVFKKLRHFKREIEVLPTIYEEDEPPDGDEGLPGTSDEMASSQTSKKKRFKRLRRWFSRLTNCCRKSREDSPG